MKIERTGTRHDYNTKNDDDNASNITTEAKGSKAKADNLTMEATGGNARAGDLVAETGDDKTKTEEGRNKSEAATREDTIAITTKKTTMITGQG